MHEDIKKNPWIWVAGIAGTMLISVILACLVMFARTLAYGDSLDDTSSDVLLTAWESRNSR